MNVTDKYQEVKTSEIEKGDIIHYDGRIWTVLGIDSQDCFFPYVYFSSNKSTKTAYMAMVNKRGTFTMSDLTKMRISPAELVLVRNF